MEITNDQLEHIKDLLNKGEITADQANVLIVRTQRVKLITCRMPAEVRKALNAAVKSGELGHIKKDGYKPEAYFHPNFEYLVNGERNKHEKKIFDAVNNSKTIV